MPIHLGVPRSETDIGLFVPVFVSDGLTIERAKADLSPMYGQPGWH